MTLDLKARDLEIKTIGSGQYEGQEIVQIKPVIAFDESFIEEMKAAGVKPKSIREDETDETEDETEED